MKWFLLLFVFGCLPYEGNESDAKKRNSADYQNRFQSFYYKYRFDYSGYNLNSNSIILKIERDNDGNFTKLQTINKRGKMVVNSIPLTKVVMSIGGGIRRKGSTPDHRFRGDSYLGQGGFYLIDHNGEMNTPTADLEPPQITFTSYRLDNRDNAVVGKGKPIIAMQPDHWRLLVKARSLPRTFPEPQPLPNYLKNWFDEEFARMTKLEHNRAITIDNDTYYGAVYQVYSNKKIACRLQIWGLDNHSVVQFLYQLRDKISLGLTNNNYNLHCFRESSSDFELSCRDGLLVDQDVFQVVNNKLTVSNRDGIIGYMDDQGMCYAGRP